jgi:SpoU rRNA methylase family enzyme
MFDKRLVFEEIDDAYATNQPDVVRLVDSNVRRPSEAKFKNDENVLLSMPGEYRPIDTGEVPPPGNVKTAY